MQRPTVSIVLYLCLVFLSGVLVGGFGFSVYSGRQGNVRLTPEQRQRRYVDEMRSRLKLSDDQVQKLKGIMAETRKRFEGLREKNRPEEQEIQAQHAQSVSAILNDTQRAEYAKMREERERRHPQPGRHP